MPYPGRIGYFSTTPGANDSFCCEDIPDDALEGAELFHFGYPPLMRSMFENGGAELEKLFHRVKGKGLLTSLDMAAVDPNSDEGRADWRAILERVLPLVDYFVPSLDEIRFMLSKPEAQPRELAEELSRMGAGTVLIKCGTDGLYFRGTDDAGTQPCFPAACLRSATGAGDTSIAAFLTGILRGRSVRYSAALAAAQGACCVTTYDALSGLKSFEELEEMVNACNA